MRGIADVVGVAADLDAHLGVVLEHARGVQQIVLVTGLDLRAVEEERDPLEHEHLDDRHAPARIDRGPFGGAGAAIVGVEHAVVIPIRIDGAAKRIDLDRDRDAAGEEHPEADIRDGEDRARVEADRHGRCDRELVAHADVERERGSRTGHEPVGEAQEPEADVGRYPEVTVHAPALGRIPALVVEQSKARAGDRGEEAVRPEVVARRAAADRDLERHRLRQLPVERHVAVAPDRRDQDAAIEVEVEASRLRAGSGRERDEDEKDETRNDETTHDELLRGPDQPGRPEDAAPARSSRSFCRLAVDGAACDQRGTQIASPVG